MNKDQVRSTEEALKLALEELENCADLLKMFEAPIDSCVGATMLRAEEAITAIKQALASPVQEPCNHNESVQATVCKRCLCIVPTPEAQPADNGPDYEDGPDEEGFSGPRPWNGFAQTAPVQEPVEIDELTDIFHKAWQKDFKESELGGMSTGSEELKGQWRKHVKAGIRALLAARPAPVQEPEDYEQLKNQRDLLVERVVYLEDQAAQMTYGQEPVAWRVKVETKLRDGSVDVGYQLRNEKLSVHDEPLYTTAAQRQLARSAWVGLTDEEIKAVIAKIDPNEHYLPNALRQLSLAIEAKLKEKNCD